MSVHVCCVMVIFFFKQKTAYEMRISDWSSDVCSSDLYPAPQCTVTQSWPINLCDPYFGIYWGCNSGDLRVDLVSCPAPVEGATPYTTTPETVVPAERNESQCSALAGYAHCTLDTEVSTASDPVPRTVDGVAVTRQS